MNCRKDIKYYCMLAQLERRELQLGAKNILSCSPTQNTNLTQQDKGALSQF